MIHKFISGLSAVERKILVFASFAVVLALFDRLLIGPSTSRLKEIDETIVKEENLVRQNVHFLVYRDSIIKHAGMYKDYFAQDVRAEEEVIADLLKRVELMATQANVQIARLSPAGQEYQRDFLKYFVSVDCSGSFSNFTSFMYAISTVKEPLKIEKMTINPSKTGDLVQATLTLSRLIIGADPSVDAKKMVRVKEDKSVVEPAGSKAE